MSGSDSHIRAAGVGSFSGRVGHKAGGFISKKFFHPSNMKNQEKLWQAIEAKKTQEKRQEELLKKREDEKRAEGIQNQLSGDLTSYVPSTVFQPSSSSNDLPKDKRTRLEQEAESQTKKRLAMVRNKSSVNSPVKIALKSRYEEDIFENGHSTVWGSFFDVSNLSWGYKCCRLTTKDSVCPHSSIP